MIGFNGGLIGGFRDTANGTASAPGVWTANEQVVARRRRMWIDLSDPFFSSVSLLLPGDGANGSTSIIDRSPSPKTITVVGNAQISTAQSKFGGSSLAFDGNGDYLTSPVSSDFEFGDQDFTIESFVYFISVAGCTIAALGEGAVGSSSPVQCAWTLRFTSSNQLIFYRYAHPTETVFSFSVNIPVNIWTHIAISRSGTSLRAFVDGIQSGAAQANSISYNRINQDNFQIGRLVTGSGTQFFTGFIDDLRITKGVARYTANFTPPILPHPLF